MKYEHGISGAINLVDLRKLVGNEYVFLDGLVVPRGKSNYSVTSLPPGRKLNVRDIEESPELGHHSMEPIVDAVCWPHGSDRNVHDYSFFYVHTSDENKPRILDVTTPLYLDLMTGPTNPKQRKILGLVVNKIENGLVRKAVQEADSLGMLEHFLNPV